MIRHQKIVEEAPITIAPPHIIKEMESAAIRLAKLVGYASAGTVEYLYEPATENYFFLELNPRLQVEHPVTEMVSGVNIPAAQLQIAMGIPLCCIRDIRTLYGQNLTGTGHIDFAFNDAKSLLIQRKPSPKVRKNLGPTLLRPVFKILSTFLPCTSINIFTTLPISLTSSPFSPLC